VVFGGIVLLNVISSIKYKNGKFEYDAERGRKATKENINGVVRTKSDDSMWINQVPN
jgi:hypothetical protein